MVVSSYSSARSSIDRRAPVISGSVQSMSGEDDFISISVPVFAPSGDALGAIGLTMGPASSFLRSLLPPSGLGETAYAQVINESGTIIASTIPPQESGSYPVTAHEERFARLIDNGEAGVWTCHRCHDANGEQGGREQDIMAFSPLTVAPWGVAIRQAKAEAFAPRNRLQNRFLVSGSIALGVALAATLLIGQTLSRPLRRLTRASRRIAEGDLDYAIAVPGKDEVGQLGRAFETMRRALKQSRQELGERSRALATLEERERIAREMHDSLSQTLNYIRLSAGVSKERLDRGDTSSLGQDLEQERQAARDAYEEVRHGIQALRANGVLERGLLPALGDFVERYIAETKLNVRISLPPSVKPDLSEEAQVQALRIVQEALANIRKHAGASRVTVEFAERPGWVDISIRDDGCGFDPSSVNSNGQHFGLQIMRERAESVGGSLDIESRAGEGTCVTVRLPAARAAREE
jgi:signal transduction histidine kinase